MTTPRATDAGRRPDIEAELKDKYHVNFLYLKNIDIDEFDVEKSLANQARLETLDEPTVELYTEAVERGDAFPAVIAYRPGRGTRPKLVIIDGNHRLIAHRNADKPINVYEVSKDTKTQMIIHMMYAFNTRHGRPTTEEERVGQAIYLIQNGATHELAAAELNVPLRVLKRALYNAQADSRAAEAGIDPREWERLPRVARTRLLQVTTDEGFLGASHLAFQAGLTADEVFEVVSNLNQTKSAAKQKAVVRSETDRYQERIQDNLGGAKGGNIGRRPMTPKARVGIILGQVLTMPEDLAGLASGYAEPERVDAAARVEDASQRLHKLALAINPRLK